MPEITPLSPELIHRANSNSFNRNRGDYAPVWGEPLIQEFPPELKREAQTNA